MTQEVKPSFSWKYLVLTLLTALIISAVGLTVSKLYQSRPVREIVVYDNGQINLLNDASLPKDQIEASYYLKGKPKKKIESLFLNLIAIKNAGNEGVENLNVTFNLKEDNAFLVSKPKIKTEPKEIIDAISVTKKEVESSDKKHVWNITLLNPGEAVLFEYSIYSQEKTENVTLSTSPRKKDWGVSSKSLIDNKKEVILPLDFLVGSAAPIFFILTIFLIAIPFYFIQWNRRPDYRENYGSFIKFYMNHRPGKLFDPPIQKKEIANNGLDDDR